MKSLPLKWEHPHFPTNSNGTNWFHKTNHLNFLSHRFLICKIRGEMRWLPKALSVLWVWPSLLLPQAKFSNITIVINMHQAFNGHWPLLRTLCTLSHLIHKELGSWRRVTSRHETANLTKAGLQGWLLTAILDLRRRGFGGSPISLIDKRSSLCLNCTYKQHGLCRATAALQGMQNFGLC